MLGCLALEDACVQTVWNWIYENWSWGFFVAVVSLWYAAKSYSKSYKSNKLSESSLDLTARSTALAEESLNAAKQAIDTSIDLYNQQKNDVKMEKEVNEKKAEQALKENLRHVILGLTPMCDNFISFINGIQSGNYKYISLDSNIYVYTENSSFTINSFEPAISSLNMLIFDATLINKTVHENISTAIIALSHFQRTTIPSVKRCLMSDMELDDIKKRFEKEKPIWDGLVSSMEDLIKYANNISDL
ncbi:hypothetical protein PSG01_01080 [Proteus mirabilis]|nr:hypothetical protein [Proteus mirabilis]MDC9776239.1 hypothetical protein [Proteus mirabilis]